MVVMLTTAGACVQETTEICLALARVVVRGDMTRAVAQLVLESFSEPQDYQLFHDITDDFIFDIASTLAEL